MLNHISVLERRTRCLHIWKWEGKLLRSRHRVETWGQASLENRKLIHINAESLIHPGAGCDSHCWAGVGRMRAHFLPLLCPRLYTFTYLFKSESFSTFFMVKGDRGFKESAASEVTPLSHRCLFDQPQKSRTFKLKPPICRIYDLLFGVVLVSGGQHHCFAHACLLWVTA